jgi:hypothetical protein
VRVVVPTAPPSGHLTAVEAALNAAGVPYGVYDVSGADDAYWTLLAALWEQGDGFIVVEHDVVVRPESIWELIGCDRPWCACPYPYLGGRGTIIGLGCTKFSGELLAAVPDALLRAGEMVDQLPGADQGRDHPRRHWCRLDSRIQRALVDSGYHVHFDHTEVGHLNERGPAHGCRR